MKNSFVVVLSIGLLLAMSNQSQADIRVGAAVTDVTPVQFPVLVNGGMLSKSATKVKTRLNARSIVVDDGEEKLAIVVVDSCMLPRPLLDDVKHLATIKTGIPADHILISSTHTHTAPSSLSCLGTETDEVYVVHLRKKLVEAIEAAQKNLEPARVGFGSADASLYTALRRWSLRPDKIRNDPFGNPTVRATMHAGANLNDATGETGPEDPELSVISFQSKTGRPIAVLANFSMHYYGDTPLSADYFGLFCNGLQEQLGDATNEAHPPFVGIMSHGCSGDIYLTDYKVPAEKRYPWKNIENYSAALVKIALEAYDSIEYQEDADIEMAERRLKMNYRVPDKGLLDWSTKIVAELNGEAPKTTEQVYAREQIILHERQSTEIVVQALRIGEIAITTTPNETYALTGLKLKHRSPFDKTMVIELANGGDGYIPPPEQHVLGGYNTWAARSAGLEVQAEPRIVEANLQLLEKVTMLPRRRYQQSEGPAVENVLTLKPLAYWRMDNMSGTRIADSTGNHFSGTYEPGVVFFLDGPQSTQFNLQKEVNRSAHFVGGRMQAHVAGLGTQYSASLWFWNGMPTDARKVSGWMFSRGNNFGLDLQSDSLGIGGTEHPGKLLFLHGADETKVVAGATAIERWSWNQVTLVRDNQQVRLYLNGKLELETKLDDNRAATSEELFIGGRTDSQSNWEGRLDEIAIFNRALTEDEVQKLKVD